MISPTMKRFLLAGACWFGFLQAALAADFNVSTATQFYGVNGQSNPTLTLTRGKTYTFSISTSGHPFWIKSTLGGGSSGRYDVGVTGNGRTSGTLTFVVATNAPSTLRYQCGVHSTMNGQINVVNPPTPPTVRVLSMSLTSSNVTIKSSGTNGFSAVPEFASNLVGTISWASVPVFTNTYANGTNTTIFNRLEPICGPNVYLRIRNQ